MENLTPEQVVEKLTAKITDATKGFATSEDVNNFKAELEGLKSSVESTEKLDEVKGAIAKLEGQVEAMKEAKKEQPKRFGSLGSAIFDAFKNAKETIEKIARKELTNTTLEVKAADTMTITGNYSGGQVALSDLEQGITRVVRRRPFLRQVSNTAGTSSKYVVYIEQKNPDPNEAGMVAEGTLKPQSDFDLVEVSKEVKKIATYIKVSKEMLTDLSFMQGEINSELMELVELKLDEQILLGSGAGANLEGIDLNATPFAAGTFAASIAAANNSDVLRVAIAQISQANFEANGIILNPADAAALQLTKSTTGEYTYPVYEPQADGTIRIKGVPVIENNLVPAGDFYVGDWTKSNLRIREDMNIQVGYVNDDFTKNLVTILAEMRAVHYVKSNHYGAFVKGDFATAIAALVTP